MIYNLFLIIELLLLSIITIFGIILMINSFWNEEIRNIIIKIKSIIHKDSKEIKNFKIEYDNFHKELDNTIAECEKLVQENKKLQQEVIINTLNSIKYSFRPILYNYEHLDESYKIMYSFKEAFFEKVNIIKNANLN